MSESQTKEGGGDKRILGNFEVKYHSQVLGNFEVKYHRHALGNFELKYHHHIIQSSPSTEAGGSGLRSRSMAPFSRFRVTESLSIK